MAEIAVSHVLDRLGKFLSGQAAIFEGVHDKVNHIKDRLALLNFYLSDAEAENHAVGETSGGAKTWLEKMREVAFQMEDVIDRYLLKVVERPQRHGVFGAVTKGVEKLKSGKHRRRISREIKKINERIDGLMEMKDSLGLNPSTNTNENPRRHFGHLSLGAHYAEESHLVGIKDDQIEMTGWLSESESKRSVMVVVGPGGIGKTTIVRNVYNKEKEKKSFECFAWITVSRPQDNNKMLREIIRNIKSAALASETPDGLPLIEKVGECLGGKRYLIVFDDVWESNFWEDVKFAMQDNKKRSRVIIITRDKSVAVYCTSDTTTKVHEMNPLPPKDALKLFRRKAFQEEEEERCPKELKALSKDFVTKCNGVPLAIVAIVGLLSTKERTVIEWQKVYDGLGTLLQSDDPYLGSVQRVMSESYHDLPSRLKPCFLYFGLFPEDYSISCMRLVRLWVAEGFVKETETEHKTMEDHAMDYLTELFQRNLVQVSGVDFDGKPKGCQVHDLMHDFIVSKCKEQSFSQVLVTKDESFAQSTSRLVSVGRRLTILAKNDESAALRSAAEWKQVRSCFVFDEGKRWPLEKPFFSSFGLLTGLDLCDAPLDLLPKEVGELLNLRYLSLRNSNISSLPKSIGKLENLQTLDLRQTQVQELPKEVKNLTKLRHLLACYGYKQPSGLNHLNGVKLMEGLQNLTSLLKMSFLDADNSSSIIEELAKLKKLRNLGIVKLGEEDGKALCKAIEGMTHLCSLSIGAMGSNGILELQSLRNPLQNLKRLYLYGRLGRLPDWIPKLENLTRLYLKGSGLGEDPLPDLNKLSKLLHLELYGTYGGNELHFKDEWFRGLKVLQIESMPMLKAIKIDKGALAHLEKMKIGNCHEMVQVPKDLQHLTSLQVLILYGMPAQFVERITGPDGEDYHWIVEKISMCLYSDQGDHFANLHNLDMS